MATQEKTKAVDAFKVKFDGKVQTTMIEEATNQRKIFDKAKMDELVESVRRQGIINPLIVREEKSSFLLIAGARRLKAAKILGFVEVPVRVVDVTPEQEQEIQAMENIQRADLTPIEEARAYATLINSKDAGRVRTEADLEDVALRVGKSKTHILRTVRLLELSLKTKDMIESGELAVAIAHQILRVPEKNRETMERFATTKGEWHKRLPTLQDVKDHIERTIEKDLKHAYFPKDVENYRGDDMPSCAVCPFNTGNQNALFDGAEDGSCTNPGCFNKRTAGFFEQMKEQGRTKFPGLKFVGIASFGYDGTHQIAGKGVVDHSTNSIKTLIAGKPEAFGIGILKPGSNGSQRAPRLVVVVSDPSVLPKKDQPKTEDKTHRVDPVQVAKQRYVEQVVERELAKVAVRELAPVVGDLLTSLVMKAIDNGGDLEGILAAFDVDSELKEKELEKKIAALKDHAKVKLLWMIEASDWRFEEHLREQGVKTKPIVTAATKLGTKEFDERNAEKCRVCSCSLDVPCQIKDAKESWRSTPCSWHDTGGIGAKICTAHPAPKIETKVKEKK